MADIRDYLAAANETDCALLSLRTYAGQVEDGLEEAITGASRAYVLVLALGFDALTAAIREASTRADYVARDMAP